MLIPACVNVVNDFDEENTEEVKVVEDGEYDDLFNNNAEKFRKLLLKKEDKEKKDWIFKGLYYYTTAGKAYTGEYSKLVDVGGVSGRSIGASVSKLFKYEYYTRPKRTNDYLNRGFEKINSV